MRLDFVLFSKKPVSLLMGLGYTSAIVSWPGWRSAGCPDGFGGCWEAIISAQDLTVNCDWRM